jgi:aspartate kinase
MDQLLATGEQQSIALLALALRDRKIPARSFTGLQAGIYADGYHMEGGSARCNPSLEKALAEGVVQWWRVFRASMPRGYHHAGRGGSDLSAVASPRPWKRRLPHLHGCDRRLQRGSRLVPEARKLSRVSYGVCMEMASWGQGAPGEECGDGGAV